MNQPKYPWRPLGRILVEEGLVGSAELEAALAEQQRTGHRLGEILVAHGTITAPDLIRVLAEQSGIDVTIAPPAAPPRPSELDDGEPKPWRPLGTLLMERGVLSEAQLADALHEQLTSDRRLGEILVERGYVTTFDLFAAVVDQQGLEPVEPGDVVSASLSSRPPEVYEVEGDDGAGGTTVLFHAGGFLEATDFAFELLESEQRGWLRIYRVRKGEREEVWAYDEDRAAEHAAETVESKDLIGLYGFNPARWTGPRT